MPGMASVGKTQSTFTALSAPWSTTTACPRTFRDDWTQTHDQPSKPMGAGEVTVSRYASTRWGLGLGGSNSGPSRRTCVHRIALPRGPGLPSRTGCDYQAQQRVPGADHPAFVVVRKSEGSPPTSRTIWARRPAHSPTPCCHVAGQLLVAIRDLIPAIQPQHPITQAHTTLLPGLLV